MLSAWRAQEARLPRPRANLRQQLDAWARQAATVRTGGLHLACELSGLQNFSDTLLSPHADQVAAMSGISIRLAPLTGAQQGLASLLASQPPSQTLALPAVQPATLVEQCWSPDGQHLVLVSLEDAGADDASESLRVSSFKGTKLVGSLLEPLTAEESFGSLHVSDNTPTFFVTVRSVRMSRVLAGTAQGAVTAARHPSAQLALSTAHLEGGRLLAASAHGDRLYVYSAFGVQEISLDRAQAVGMIVLVSSWGDLAAVVLSNYAQDSPHQLALVDLACPSAQHCCQLPQRPSKASSVAQGACSVAVCMAYMTVSVFAPLGGEVGWLELFRVPGREAGWNALGRFLAVINQHQVHIFDGLTGAPLACWNATPKPVVYFSMRWLPDSRGLVALASAADGGRGWYILTFASTEQPEL